jgi:hypothetical protein
MRLAANCLWKFCGPGSRVAALDGGLMPRHPLRGHGSHAARHPGSHVRCSRWVLADRMMRCFPSPPAPTFTARGHLRPICGCYMPVSVPDSRPMPVCPLQLCPVRMAPSRTLHDATCRFSSPALLSLIIACSSLLFSLRIILYFLTYYLHNTSGSGSIGKVAGILKPQGGDARILRPYAGLMAWSGVRRVGSIGPVGMRVPPLVQDLLSIA